jgi:Fic family protein
MKIFAEIDKLQEQINSLRPLSESQLVSLRQYYRIGLTYTSNALEGNSLTETETKVILEDGITIGGKPLKHHLEATGHSKAYTFLYDLLEKDFLQETDIKKLHRLFYELIEPEKAGEYRKEQVFISGSHYKLPKAEKIPKLMADFVVNYSKNTNRHAVETAALMHKDFVFIHPFVDGNGRVARLLMNFALMKNRFPVTIIPPILRVDDISALEKAHTNDAEFIELIANCVKQSQWEYIRLVD